MARPVRPWFRFYVETFGDRKIRRLKPAQRWVWTAILGAARESPEPGKLYVAPGVPMSAGELADYAGVAEKEVHATIAAASSLSMVTLDGDLMVVTNWDKRQFESDNVTERTREHRERSREQDKNVPKNVPGNTPERTRAFATETEAEAETDSTYGAGARKRAHQLPDDWQPNDAHRALAAERGVDVNLEATKMRDWAAAEGKTGKDWDARFRNWLRSARQTQAPGIIDRRVPNAPIEAPPDGLDDNQLAAWYAEHTRRRA